MNWTCEETKVESNRFDQSADYYDLYRPTYPKEMIDKIVFYSGIDIRSAIVEIGAGSGKATKQLLDRGYTVTGVEQGRHLAEAGMKKYSDTGRLTYRVGRFEEMDFQKESVDLVFSAQAFHWIEKPLGYAITKNMLKENGAGALIWNKYLNDESLVSESLKKICSKYGVMYMQGEEEIFTMCERDQSTIVKTGYFKDVELFSVPWQEEQTLEDFLNFLKTGNGYLALKDDAKEALQGELEIVFRDFGNKIIRKYVCIAYLFKKK